MIRVTPVSACTADIQWEMSQTIDPRTAQPSYVVVEASLTMDGSSGWVHVGQANVTGQSSLRGMIPPGGVNTSYWLRARSGNTSVGEGANFLQNTQFLAYTQGE